jgi:chromate transport protein ChrA
MSTTPEIPQGGSLGGSPLEVFRIFAKLGFTCFGGPIAHIGYFREEFVVRRKWIDEHAYADLVGLCQFLPGPASSQVGFSIGLMRAGYLGGFAAWTGFTLPSAALLVLFAYGAGALQGPVGQGLLHGLKLTAVAIVAQAVWGMARNLCPDRERASITVVAALLILLSAASIAQIGAIVLGGVAGLWLCRSEAPAPAARRARRRRQARQIGKRRRRGRRQWIRSDRAAGEAPPTERRTIPRVIRAHGPRHRNLDVPGREEPLPSYGASARGRPRSRLARGAWSRSLQARLGRVSSYDLLKSAAALTLFVSLTRARGAPPREEPLPSYGASARGRPRSRLARGAWSRSLQARLGRVSSYDLLKSAAALTLFVSLTRARGAPPRVETRRLLTNHPC